MVEKRNTDPWAPVRAEVAWVRVGLAKLDARVAELRVKHAEHPDDEAVYAALHRVQANADELRGSLQALEDRLAAAVAS